MKTQRLRVTFTRGEEMKYITHLDMMRFWERALRRADIPVTYSEGFSPHPQIALASPLAVGTTSECELMDVFLDERMTPRAFIDAISPQVPPAIAITAARETGLALPSLQADVRAAEYEVDTPVAEGADIEAAIREMLAAETIPWQHKREEDVKSYDLRPLVMEVDVVERGDASVRLRMLLRNDSTTGAGRPEQVALALGCGVATRIHRTRLVLAERSPAREAYRKAGRYAV